MSPSIKAPRPTETLITVQSTGETLRGVLHLPVGNGQFPAALLCHGYFQANRIGPARLHVEIARELAARGIACLRVDCAGFGESDGSYEETSYSRLVENVSDAFAYMARLEGVDVDRLGLIGHSYGANLSVDLASSNSAVNRLCLLGPDPTDRPDASKVFSESQVFELRSHGRTERHGLLATADAYSEILDGVTYRKAKTVNSDTHLFFGDADLHDEQLFASLANAFPRRATLRCIRGADHNFLPVTTRPALIGQLASALWPTHTNS